MLSSGIHCFHLGAVFDSVNDFPEIELPHKDIFGAVSGDSLHLRDYIEDGDFWFGYGNAFGNLVFF